MNLLKLITGIFSDESTESSPLVDPTVYRIKTASHEYEGRIIHQNDVAINFSIGHKAVKILKANIMKIHVLATAKVSAVNSANKLQWS